MTITTLLEVSVEYVEDCSDDIKAWELQVKGVNKACAPVLDHVLKRDILCFKDCCCGKGGIFNPTCHRWLGTRFKLNERGARDVERERESERERDGGREREGGRVREDWRNRCGGCA